MPLIYKRAGAESIPLITGLAHSIWKKYYSAIISMEQIDYMLERFYSSNSLLQQMRDGQLYTLVFDGTEAIGFLSLSTKTPGNYFLHKFYINTERQKQGIGKGLFEFVLSQAEKPQRIELTVNRMNYKAINFYFKLGFAIDRCEDFDIGNGFFMNDFVMTRKSHT